MLSTKDSIICILEPQLPVYKECSIASFLEEHYYPAHTRSESYDQYVFDPGTMYIQDRDGWTSLLSVDTYQLDQIREQDELNSIWYEIQCPANGQILYITNDEQLMIYDIQHMKTGFHGESIYNYTLRTPLDIIQDDSIPYMRIHGLSDLNNPSPIWFNEIYCNTYEFHTNDVVKLHTQSLHATVNSFDIYTP